MSEKIQKCEKEMLTGENQNSVTDVEQTQNHLSDSKRTLICSKNSQVLTDLQDIQNFNVSDFQKIRRCEKEMFGSCESQNSVTNLVPTHNHLSNLKQNSVCDKNMQILTDLQQIQNFGVTSFQRTDIPHVDFHPCSKSPTNLQPNPGCLDDFQSVKNFDTVLAMSQDCRGDLEPTEGSIMNIPQEQHDPNSESEICDKNSNFNALSENMEQLEHYRENSTNVKEECIQEISDSSVSGTTDCNETKSSSDKNNHILNDLQQIQNLGVDNFQQRTEICRREFSKSPAILQQSPDRLHDSLSNSDLAQYCSADLEQTRDNCHEQHDPNPESKISEENSDSGISSSENVKTSEPYPANLSYVTEKCDRDVNGSNECNKNEPKELSFSDILQDLNSHDSKRIRRNNKRKRDLEEYCPICGLTVRNSELESHFAKEVESLSNVAKNIRKPREKKKDGVNITFVRVKCNRENRLAAKVAKYSKKNEVQCPVCKMRITGSESEVNEHVLNCAEDEDSDVNILDHDDSFEEYEIGNETRVRAISFVPGGYRSLHGQSSRNKSEDVDDDLNVDIDDTSSYGKPQELDIIHNKANGTEDEDSEKLRRAVVFDPTAEPHVIEGRKWTQDCEITDEVAKILSTGKESLPKSSTDEGDDSHFTDENSSEENVKKVESDIISSLKEKIRDLEQQKNVKCLICLEPYTKPVVATTCWHVHCEECWLVTMGVKKLCPQCNTIVFPTNLRRIYL